LLNSNDSSTSSVGNQADADFAQWLAANGVADKVIFHTAPGPDHLVGTENYRRGNPNQILAITSWKAVLDAYANLITEISDAGRHYKILFGDLYTLSARILPLFDLVTLFHIAERPSEEALADDKRLIALFLSRINPEGRLLFSSEDESAARLVSGFVTQRRMAIESKHESLVICRRTW